MITSRKQIVDGKEVGKILFEYISSYPFAKPRAIQDYFVKCYWTSLCPKMIKDARYDFNSKRNKKCVNKFESKWEEWKFSDASSDDLDDALSALDKAVEKLQKRWVNVKVDYNAVVNKHEPKRVEPFVWGDSDNILVIWDAHMPATVDWYLEFCREQQERFNCWKVVYIWDIVDFNSISYHEKIPEILNPKWEVDSARTMLKDWYYTFPTATVLLGNHDLLPYRQARTSWLLREFIKSPHAIFEAPESYSFENEITINNVLYTHWTNWNAFKKCVNEWMSLVQWHLHTQSWVIYHRSRNWQIFWCQVGTWIDFEQTNFDYAKTTAKKAILSCAVILKQWDINLPIVIPMI